MEQADNVEYLIEWFADGKSLKVETERCHQKDIVPCPKETKIRSKLLEDKYRAGKWVSCFFFCLFVCLRLPLLVVVAVVVGVYLLNEQTKTLKLIPRTISQAKFK